MKKSVFIFLCLCWTAANSLAVQPDYSFREEYPVSGAAHLNISSSDGDIEVTPGDVSKIQVYFIVKKNGFLQKIDRKGLEKDFNVTISHNSSSVEISVTPIKKIGFNFNLPEVNFFVITPKRTACQLKTSDGDVKIAGLAGSLECKTSDGDITLADIMGSIQASTSDGDIAISNATGDTNVKTSDGDIALQNITGTIRAKTSDGDIMASQILGDITSSTSDGNIHITKATGNTSVQTSDGNIQFSNITGGMQALCSDGNIKGSIQPLSSGLSAKTSDGNIDVTIPEELGLDLDIRGESLQVPLKNFSGTSDKRNINGKANGGGIPVSLQTASGNVRLNYR